MSRIETAEEVKQSHIKEMGSDLGPLYHALWNELVWLYFKWGEYVELFGTKPSRIDLINRAAGYFFRVVQDSLWYDSLLHIARLTDPPESCRKKNLSIQQLPLLIDDHTLKEKVEKLVDVAIEKAEFCRDWRNRRIAHKDLGLALGVGAKSLKPASRAEIKESLTSISNVLNAISLHYMNSEITFEGEKTSDGAVSLLYVLDDGLRAEEERKERLKAGTYRSEDYRKRDL